MFYRLVYMNMSQDFAMSQKLYSCPKSQYLALIQIRIGAQETIYSSFCVVPLRYKNVYLYLIVHFINLNKAGFFVNTLLKGLNVY